MRCSLCRAQEFQPLLSDRVGHAMPSADCESRYVVPDTVEHRSPPGRQSWPRRCREPVAECHSGPASFVWPVGVPPPAQRATHNSCCSSEAGWSACPGAPSVQSPMMWSVCLSSWILLRTTKFVQSMSLKPNSMRTSVVSLLLVMHCSVLWMDMVG